MAEFAVRLAAVGAMLLLPPVAIAPDGTTAEDSPAAMPASVADFVLLANDGTLPAQSGEIAVITASTAPLPELTPLDDAAATEPPPTLAALLGASAVIDLGQAVPAGLPGGSAIPSEFLGEDGLGVDYFAGADLSEPPALQLAQSSSVVRLPAGAAAARVAGEIAIPVDGSYEFTFTATGAARMLVDGAEVATLDPAAAPDPESAEAAAAPQTATVTLDLVGGTSLLVQLELVDESSAEPVLALGWRPPAEVTSSAIESVLKAADAADTVLIQVPSLPARAADADSPATVAGALPVELAELLAVVAVANPRMVVVTDAAADDKLDGWTAPAVLHVPTGAPDLESLARVITGEAQPSGTLQAALPLSHGPPSELDAQPQEADQPRPLYPAGHGLTYWSYQLVSMTAASNGAAAHEAVVEVAATGTAPGSTDIHLAASTAGSEELHPVASAAVELAGGQTASVTIPLDLSALSLESPEAWPVTLHAGTSPDTLTLTAELQPSETSKTPTKQPAERQKQPKQGGIVRPAVSGLALTTGAGAVMLQNAVEVDGQLRLTGTLPTVSVSDARQGTGTGWTVSARASDLTGPGGALPASNLGWTPLVLASADGVSAGPPVAGSLSGGQGLGEPAVLGHASGPVGTAQFGADFVLETPATTVPGSYTGTLTVTLFPVE